MFSGSGSVVGASPAAAAASAAAVAAGVIGAGAAAGVVDAAVARVPLGRRAIRFSSAFAYANTSSK